MNRSAPFDVSDSYEVRHRLPDLPARKHACLWGEAALPCEAMYKEINPKIAKDTLDGAKPAIYLDVRTAEEFAQGHVPGAYCIPIRQLTPTGMMQPNEDFPRVVQAHVPKDATIIVGCKSGQRSAQAADLMVRLGYTDVSNMLGGFCGQHSPGGEMMQAGWQDLTYPVSNTPTEGRSYAELLAQA